MNVSPDRLRRWFLLAGNRYAVAGMTLVFVALVLFSPAAFGLVLLDKQPLYYMYTGLIAGNITLITVTVSINQLLLSRDLKSPNTLQNEIQETDEYRRSATDRLAVPTEPSAFLRRVSQQLRQHAHALGEPRPDPSDRRLVAETDRLIETLTDHADRVDAKLDPSEATLFSAVLVVLDADYAERMQEIQRMRTVRSNDLSDDLDSVLDRLLAQLRDIDIARQYCVTVYIQRELSRLSRRLLYVGLPAVTLSAAMLIHLTGYGTSPPNDLLGPVVVSGVVGLTPLALLSSFVLRVSAVAQAVTSITPFDTS